MNGRVRASRPDRARREIDLVVGEDDPVMVFLPLRTLFGWESAID
jgi:hypothetical protein